MTTWNPFKNCLRFPLSTRNETLNSQTMYNKNIKQQQKKNTLDTTDKTMQKPIPFTELYGISKHLFFFYSFFHLILFD